MHLQTSVYLCIVAKSPCPCLHAKPPSLNRILGFVDGHNKTDYCTVPREVNFGATVASTFWSKRLAIV